MKPFLCSVTKGKKEQTLLYKTFNQQGLEFFFVEDNTKSLSSVYNKAIEFAINENCDYLVLCHDDVIIESDIYKKLNTLFQKYDVVGVAGTSKCEFKSPALWHLMGGGFGSGNLHGAVAHGDDKKIMTSFGIYPNRVVMIDGVFMAIKREVFENVKFDESCPSKFHFYDLQFSLDSHNKNYKVGVGDIMITHASPGLREYTEEWKAGEKWFLEKYEH